MIPEEYDNAPEKIKAILDSYDEDCENSYKECERIINELENEGYTADYDLSGELFDLEKL